MVIAGGDELELGHAVHRIDVIHPFHPVLVALMHAVDADVARHPVGLGRARRCPMGTPVGRVNDRFRTSAAQTHFSLEIRAVFRLISYWKRLFVAFL